MSFTLYFIAYLQVKASLENFNNTFDISVWQQCRQFFFFLKFISSRCNYIEICFDSLFLNQKFKKNAGLLIPCIPLAGKIHHTVLIYWLGSPAEKTPARKKTHYSSPVLTFPCWGLRYAGFLSCFVPSTVWALPGIWSSVVSMLQAEEYQTQTTHRLRTTKDVRGGDCLLILAKYSQIKYCSVILNWQK